MNREELATSIAKQIEVSFSRSGGPGGQNVNKVNTKVTARLPLAALAGLEEAEVARLRQKLAGRLNSEEEIVLQVQETRSQAQNRQLAEERMRELVLQALRRPRRRRPTRPSRAARERRLTQKKRRGEKKRQRRKGGWE